MRRGDVVRVELPRPQGKPGHEQHGKRPAVVVQSNAVTPNLSTAIVVPLTSSLSAAKFPGTFVVQPDAVNGLDVASVVLTNQIRTIDKTRIESRPVGTLSADDLKRLEDGLRQIMNL